MNGLSVKRHNFTMKQRDVINDMLFYFEKYVKQFLQRIIKTKESIYIRYALSSIACRVRLTLLRIFASDLQTFTLTRDEKRKDVGTFIPFSRHRCTSCAFHACVRYIIQYTTTRIYNVEK